MKLKEIWSLIKTVIWPAAKPFICASREEAQEVVDMWRTTQRQKNDLGLSPDFVPVFVLRCIDALENEETTRQTDPAPGPKPKINGFGVWLSDWWKD